MAVGDDGVVLTPAVTGRVISIRRYDTERRPEGTIWRYWLSADDGRGWHVALIGKDQTYRFWIEDEPGSPSIPGPAVFVNRQEALRAATQMLEQLVRPGSGRSHHPSSP